MILKIGCARTLVAAIVFALFPVSATLAKPEPNANRASSNRESSNGASSNKSNKKNCWVLTQVNPNSPYSHSQVTIIAPEGVCISADDVKLFMPAPNYEVSIYNNSSKEFYRAPLKVWMSKYGAQPFSKSGKYMKKFGSGEIGGVAAEQYFMMRGEGAQAHKEREVWSTKAIQANTEVQHILQHICGMPEGSIDGVPLRVVRLLAQGHSELLLNTLSVKKVASPKGAFVQPSGYKKVNNELTLMMNYGKNGDLKDLLEGTTDSRK